MSQLNNIRTVSVPSIGKLPLADKPGTFTPSGTKREHKPGRLAQDGGHTESSVPAKLELNLNLTPGLDVDAINDITDEDVTVRLADGTVYLMSQAFTSDPVPVGDGDGKVTIIANTSERIS
ncbi:phage tail protein (plasmid) [Ralstonia pseudosolanacearum]|uniref:phage tail tube protein n=1 Tax=Ralstonia pseudosolanacearum TaxID=1310165 RepID=UPI000909BABD|nr:phage tail tube protein [Ralstonia pseudosolanacearum]API77961.1 phage tail protein [Ralstonia pseudosolanacearum]